MKNIFKLSTRIFLCIIALFILSIVGKSDFSPVFAFLSDVNVELQTRISQSASSTIDLNENNSRQAKEDMLKNNEYRKYSSKIRKDEFNIMILNKDKKNINKYSIYKELTMKNSYKIFLSSRKYEMTSGPPVFYV